MLLFLLRSFRQASIRVLPLCLVVNIAAPALGSLPPPVTTTLNTPTITNVSGTCHAMTAVWSDSGTDAQYMIVLNGNQSISQIVQGTSFTFSTLTAGTYTLTVQAVSISGSSGDSGFSPTFTFTVVCAPACQAPVVQVISVDPNPICRQEHGVTPVTFHGSVTSACASSGVQYTLTDSRGPGSQGPVNVNADGSFAVNLMLSARHVGRAYTLTVSATNVVGSASSAPVTVSVQKCRHHRGDKDDDDNDRDHDDD